MYEKLILTKADLRSEKFKIFKEQIKCALMKNIISLDESSVNTHIDHNYGRE